MEHTFTYLKDFGPYLVTIAFAFLIRTMRRFNRAAESLAETRFKADECHDELSERKPEYKRSLATWKAHRKTF
jgi:hypothetical protein